MMPLATATSNANVHRSILYGRVGDAVRNVCDFGTDFTKGTDYRTCCTKAWSGARPQCIVPTSRQTGAFMRR